MVVENIAEDPLWRNLQEAADVAGVAACWSHPITAANGNVLGAMALYYDEPRKPTDRQMAELAIAAGMVGLAVERDRFEEKRRQSAKMEALGVLAGGIAHDFNNLLVAIQGNAELAAMTLPDESREKAMLERIMSASAGATELCNQMLAYSGQGVLATEPIECNALVKELGGLLGVALSKKATLVYELHEQPLVVRADPGQMRQVIMNLITNASEALGGQEGRIVVSSCTRAYSRDELDELHADQTLEAGEYVTLSVSDTGRGMTLETRGRVFDPFFTTKSAGRGLGLAAVQGIVRRHRGAIVLDTGPDQGTTFSVLLPRVHVAVEPAKADAAPAARKPGARILVVDDEPHVREVFQGMLEEAGYAVVCASNGQEALEVFAREGDSIDCVLLDLSMPRLNGEEVFRELRAIRDDVRVILCSGFAEQQVKDRFQESGVAGFIKKPALMHDLLRKVESAFSKSTA